MPEPIKGQEGQAPAVTPEAGKAGEDQGDAHSQTFQVPEKLKGKSAEELAKSYVELEKKLGEHSTEVAEARKKVEDALKLQTDAVEARKTLQELTELIYADPERIKAVESWYTKKTGATDNQQPNGQTPKPGEAQPSSQDLDTRKALQDQMFNDFYDRTGISRLPTKEKTEAIQKVASEFAEMFDPTGKKSISQIVNERPLSSLKRDLDRAYRLVDIGQNAGDTQSALAQEQNNQAAIGSLQGATIREDQVKLTPSEEQMAKNLGISSEKYLERKKEILKEKGSVS